MIHVRKLALAGLLGAVLVACGSSGAVAQAPEKCSPAAPCGDDNAARGRDGYSVVHVQVDGRPVTCIVVRADYKSAGISCDWMAR
jgi:hypothetical protein